MKGRLTIAVLTWVLLGMAAHGHCQDTTLGQAHFGLKVDYIGFTDDAWDDNDLDNGILFGFMAYGRVSPHWYIGGEIAYADLDGRAGGIKTELTCIPVELNLKYTSHVTGNIVFGAGGGVSLTFTDGDVVPATFTDPEDSEQLWGGQVFADLSATFDWFFVGVDFKYQFTESFGGDADLNNYRVGGHIGIMF